MAGYRAANEAAAPEALTVELGEVQDAAQVAAALRAFRDFGATYSGSPLAPTASTRSALGRSLEAIFARQKQLDAVRAKDVLDVLDAHAACGAIPPAPNAVDALGGAARRRRGICARRPAARLRAFPTPACASASPASPPSRTPSGTSSSRAPRGCPRGRRRDARRVRSGAAAGRRGKRGRTAAPLRLQDVRRVAGGGVTDALAALRGRGAHAPDDAAASLEALEKLPHVGAGVAEDVRAALRGAAEGGSAARGGRGAEP